MALIRSPHRHRLASGASSRRSSLVSRDIAPTWREDRYDLTSGDVLLLRYRGALIRKCGSDNAPNWRNGRRLSPGALPTRWRAGLPTSGGGSAHRPRRFGATRLLYLD